MKTESMKLAGFSNDEILQRLQNFVITEAGSAIVDAAWFSSPFMIGIVLICTQELIWKAYIGAIPSYDFQLQSEAESAMLISEFGVKISYSHAAAVFPGRFSEGEYDK